MLGPDYPEISMKDGEYVIDLQSEPTRHTGKTSQSSTLRCEELAKRGLKKVSRHDTMLCLGDENAINEQSHKKVYIKEIGRIYIILFYLKVHATFLYYNRSYKFKKINKHKMSTIPLKTFK